MRRRYVQEILMNNKFKVFWFKYYVYIVLSSLIIIAFSIYIWKIGDNPLALFATFAGIALTVQLYILYKSRN